MKAEIPAAIPASIVSAKAGLAAISAKTVSPAGTDLYNEFVNDEPMTNNIGIATISPTDHLPNVALGVILQGCFVMLSPFRSIYSHPILHSRDLFNPRFPRKGKPSSGICCPTSGAELHTLVIMNVNAYFRY
jgi:hypothetical protein